MNLETAQHALAQLLTGGAFRFDNDIATVPYDEYRDIITALQPPQPYSIGYDLGGINWLENCYLDEENGFVEMIRRERTWQHGNLRAFQLELTQVPRLILVVNEPPKDPTTLSTTWYTAPDGSVVAYIQILNGTTIEDIRI